MKPRLNDLIRAGKGFPEIEAVSQQPLSIEMTMNIKYAALTFLLFLALQFTFERRAYAYVDPGSGLLIMQGLGAICSGVIFYFRRRIRCLFSREPQRAAQADNATGPDKRQV
jgi:hypothetical protein